MSDFDWSTWGPLLAIGGGAIAGSMDGSQQSGTSTSTTAPWQPQQPYLQDLFARAQTMSQNPYSNQYMTSALSGMQNAMNSGMTNQAQSYISNLMGMNPQSAYGIGMRNPYMGQTTNVGFNPYSNYNVPQIQNANSAMPGQNRYLGAQTGQVGAALGPGSIQSGGQSQAGTNAMLGMDNPYLNKAISRAQDDVESRINSRFNNNAFGSTAHQQTLSRELGNVSNQMRMQDYGTQQQLQEADVNRRLSNQQFNIGNQNALNQFNAGLGFQNANILNSMGQFNAGLSQADLGRNAGLDQSYLQNQQQNNQFNATNQNAINQFNAGNLITGNQFNAQMYQQFLNNQMQAQANDLSRNANLAQTGINNDISQYNNLLGMQSNAAFNTPQFGTAQMGNWMNLYNAGMMDQNAMWNPLQNYGSLIGGGFGSTSSSPIYSNPYAGALGGAFAGSSIYNNLFGG